VILTRSTIQLPAYPNGPRGSQPHADETPRVMKYRHFRIQYMLQLERRTIGRRRMNMTKGNNAPQEQGAQEETHPVCLDHEDIDPSELENISGGAKPVQTCTCVGICPIAVLIG